LLFTDDLPFVAFLLTAGEGDFVTGPRTFLSAIYSFQMTGIINVIHDDRRAF